MDRLIDELARLPSIGRRTAERLAFHLLKASEGEALGLAAAIGDLKRCVRNCSACFNLTEGDRCAICADERRDRTSVLVVEQPRDLIALEQTGMYRGLYHVLLGRLSPLEGVGPEELTIASLLHRIDEPSAMNGGNPDGVQVQEVILGLNPDTEGDGTAMHIAEQLRSRPVRVSRLARGIPTGWQLEFANRAVLADALTCRQRME